MRRKLVWIMLSTAGILYSAMQLIVPEGRVHAGSCCVFSSDCKGGGTCTWKASDDCGGGGSNLNGGFCN
jgi:hypothetical protein